MLKFSRTLRIIIKQWKYILLKSEIVNILHTRNCTKLFVLEKINKSPFCTPVEIYLLLMCRKLNLCPNSLHLLMNIEHMMVFHWLWRSSERYPIDFKISTVCDCSLQSLYKNKKINLKVGKNGWRRLDSAIQKIFIFYSYFGFVNQTFYGHCFFK